MQKLFRLSSMVFLVLLFSGALATPIAGQSDIEVTEVYGIEGITPGVARGMEQAGQQIVQATLSLLQLPPEEREGVYGPEIQAN